MTLPRRPESTLSAYGSNTFRSEPRAAARPAAERGFVNAGPCTAHQRVLA